MGSVVEATTEMGVVLSEARPGEEHITYVNQAGVSEDVMRELSSNRDVASAIEQWSQELRAAAESSSASSPSAFLRHRNSTHRGVFAQMAQCAWAVEADDVLSTLADVTESVAFQKVRFELYDPQQQDVWNQWAKIVDLDGVLRTMFRELLKVSQVYVGMLWTEEVLKVRHDPVGDAISELEQQAAERSAERQARFGLPSPTPIAPPKSGTGRGNYERVKKFALKLPTALTVFDPTKVVPVGMLMFGMERFAYVASDSEESAFASIFVGKIADGLVIQMIERKYIPSTLEAQELIELGVNIDRLWLMRRDAVFRHTLTRASYERFSPLRLRSVLPLLEMKAHLRSSDRASLLGNTNFIIVVTKGTDKLPAKPGEIENLQEQVKVIARLPVLVGDHRLHVEIVTPALDNTLIESRWEVLDARLVFKVLQTFQPTITGGGATVGVSEMSRVVARGLESRRHMLVRSLERHLFDEIMAKNDNMLTEDPALAFSPRRISLDFSAEIINGVLKLRDRGDISRETTLEELDYDQDVEVLRRAREKVEYDAVFSSQTPYSSPQANPFAANQPVDSNTPPDPNAPEPPVKTPVTKAPSVRAPGAAPQPGSNVGPKGQPRTEGGRPPGVTETAPRATTKK